METGMYVYFGKFPPIVNHQSFVRDVNGMLLVTVFDTGRKLILILYLHFYGFSVQ